MKILIAPDSSSTVAAEYIRNGIGKVFRDAAFVLHPMADGGEGTVDAILKSSVGRKIHVPAHDPLKRQIDSYFGLTENGRTAVIEMAAASGMAKAMKNFTKRVSTQLSRLLINPCRPVSL